MAKAKAKRTDISINEGDATATWSMTAHGELQGTYMGQFKFRCYLSPIDRLAAGREYRELIGAHPELATENEKFLAYSMSQLKYRILASPPFWTQNEVAGNIPDEKVITAVLDAAFDAEVMFKDSRKKSTKQSIARATKAAEKIVNQQVEEDDEDEAEDPPSDG